MLVVPEFPPPDFADPDEVGWPLCAAAAMWRAQRYDEAVGHVRAAAATARALGLSARGLELDTSLAVLETYLGQWKAGRARETPASVSLSPAYPTLEILESVLLEEGTSLEQLVRSYPPPPADDARAEAPSEAAPSQPPRRTLPPVQRAYERSLRPPPDGR